MELGAIFVGLAILVAGLPFVVKPLREKRPKKDRKPNIRANTEEKRRADLSALLDLDFDFRTGKVSEEDYSIVRAQLMADAAQYIQPDNSVEDDQLEAMIHARKAAQIQIQKCLGCGNKIEAGNRFCPQCGMTIANTCPACDRPVQSGDFFCTACGATLACRLEPMP